MSDRPKRYVHNIPAARALRKRETKSEDTLWERIRDRRLGGLKFRRQHAIGRYVVDFFCAESSLAVEIDGSMHDDPEVLKVDADRQRILEAAGLHFVRVKAYVVESDINQALSEIAKAAHTPSGSPLPRSRERGRG